MPIWRRSGWPTDRVTIRTRCSQLGSARLAGLRRSGSHSAKFIVDDDGSLTVDGALFARRTDRAHHRGIQRCVRARGVWIKIQNKTRRSCGVPKGIGAACAIALAEAGASICLLQREVDSGATPNLETLTTLRALGVAAEIVYCDLADVRSVNGAFEKALNVMGGHIHILVNCAGIQRRSPSIAFSETDWDDVGTILLFFHFYSFFFYFYLGPHPSPIE